MRYSRPGYSENFPDPEPVPSPVPAVEARVYALLRKAREANVSDADLEAGINIAEAAVKALLEDRK